MPNRFVPLNPGSSYEEDKKAINGNFAELDGEAVTKVFKGPNGVNALIQGRLPGDNGYGFLFNDPSDTPRVILHFDSDGNPVFKISESGVDVTTATEDQLTFNSTRNVFKVVATDTISVNKPANEDAVTITLAHGLSYVPGFVAYALESGVYHQTPLVVTVSTGSAGSGTTSIYYVARIGADVDNLYFIIEAGEGPAYLESITVDFRYYLFIETAS